tara:strand:+ start:493 stop:609 length:117 start_codon:yes stop_codon:yes gene_type:complete
MKAIAENKYKFFSNKNTIGIRKSILEIDKIFGRVILVI